MNINTLDSNRLLNLKTRFGLSISDSSSTSIYLSSKKLEKKLTEKLKNNFKYKIDLDIYIDKILSKLKSIELIENTSIYIDSVSNEVLLEESSNLKKFIVKLRNLEY